MSKSMSMSDKAKKPTLCEKLVQIIAKPADPFAMHNVIPGDLSTLPKQYTRVWARTSGDSYMLAYVDEKNAWHPVVTIGQVNFLPTVTNIICWWALPGTEDDPSNF